MKREKKQKNSKYSLLKVIGISFVLFAIATWIIPAGIYSGSVYSEAADGTIPVGLFGLFINPTYSFGIFVQYFLVFLAIGGFYGVLNKTEAYGKLIEGISKKIKKHKGISLVVITVLLALLSAIVGNSIAMFLLVPLFVAVLMNVGFHKITSLAATAGAILVGAMGSIIGNDVIFINFLQIDKFNGIWIKVIYFAIIVSLYSLFLLYRSGILKIGKKKKNDKEEEIIDEKEVEIPLYVKSESKKNVIPLLIILVLTCILVLMGVMNWEYTLEISFFNDLYTSMEEITWLSKIFGVLPVIGYFGNYDITAILLVASLLIKWVYSIKFDNFIDAFTDGAKKMLKPAIYVIFASVIFAVMVNNNYNISATITNILFKMPENLYVLMMTLLGYVGGFFFNDFPYLVNSMYGVLANQDSNNYTIIAVILQTGYGLAMMSLPVSVVLIGGLKYLGISYKEWMKYIYQFLLAAFVLIIVFALIILAI